MSQDKGRVSFRKLRPDRSKSFSGGKAKRYLGGGKVQIEEDKVEVIVDVKIEEDQCLSSNPEIGREVKTLHLLNHRLTEQDILKVVYPILGCHSR